MTDMSIELSEVNNLLIGEHIFDANRRIVRFEFAEASKSGREAAAALVKNREEAAGEFAAPVTGSIPSDYRYAPAYEVKKTRLNKAGIFSHSEVYMCTGLIFSQRDTSDFHIQLSGEELLQLVSRMNRYLQHCNPDARPVTEGGSAAGSGGFRGVLETWLRATESNDEKAERRQKLRNLSVVIDRSDDELDRRLKDTRHRPRPGRTVEFDGIIGNDKPKQTREPEADE